MAGVGQGKPKRKDGSAGQEPSKNAMSLRKGNRRPISMPTRERILALISILNDFDADHPLKKKDIYELLYYKYSIFLLSQLDELLPESGKDIKTAKRLILQLKGDLQSRINFFERENYMRDIKENKEDEDASALDIFERLEKLEMLKDIVNSSIEATHKDYVSDIFDILCKEDPDSCFAPGTLSEDFKALVHEDYGFAESVGSEVANHANWGIYGKYLFNNLDIWQLKIIFEAIIGIPFLQLKDIESISASILNSTSLRQYSDAKKESFVHKLDDEYYSSSPTFGNNLRLLIDAHMSQHNVSFNYQYSTVDREKKIFSQSSPVEVYPVDIVFKDGYFYLLGANGPRVITYRVDRIADLKKARYNLGYMRKYPELEDKKEEFFRNNTNNYSYGKEVGVVVRWDMNYLGRYTHYTPLFDVFGYENISQGPEEDQFIIKTRDNYGMYLNLLRLGPVIEVVGPPDVREKYADMVRRMAEKHQLLPR